MRASAAARLSVLLTSLLILSLACSSEESRTTGPTTDDGDVAAEWARVIAASGAYEQPDSMTVSTCTDETKEGDCPTILDDEYVVMSGLIDQHVRRKCAGANGRAKANRRERNPFSRGESGSVRISRYIPMTAVGSTKPTGPLARTPSPMAA